MTQRLEYMLNEWGRWVEKNVNWADCLGENVLYRAGILSGRVQEGLSGHRILCPDASPKIRAVEVAVRRLSDPLQDAIILRYCLPAKKDEDKYFTKQELADVLEITESAFKARLNRARKILRKALTV
jgi:hypothetical protein